MHGTEDALVPDAQSERLVTALREAGARTEHLPVPGAAHLWLGIAEEEVERCFTTTLDFAARSVG
ncbi:alpha/beta hydrolase family protein [Streptomyces sp. NPDC054804]